MIKRLLKTDESGAATVEMAFALPILIIMMIGILQYAIVAQTTSGMRHAIGEAVRYAKVYPDADQDEVLDVARDRFVGINADGITGLTLQRGTASNGADFGTVTMRYRLEPVVPFMSLTEINLEESRTVYLQATD